jgi:hypothetical protein
MYCQNDTHKMMISCRCACLTHNMIACRCVCRTHTVIACRWWPGPCWRACMPARSAFQNLRLGSMDLPGCSPARVKERKCNPVLKSVNGDCYTSRTNNMISCRCACRPHMISCRCVCLTHSRIASRCVCRTHSMIEWWCSCQTHTVIWYHADVSVEITTWYCFIVM